MSFSCESFLFFFFITFLVVVKLWSNFSAQMTNYQRQMDDMRGQYEHQQNRLQGRDVQNAQEIDQLHRKCICLTKL